MSERIGVGILGMGSSLPEKVLTNQDLEKMVDTSDEWIVKRTGISERRILDANKPSYEMGVKAAAKAIEDAELSAEDIDLIIVATETPDYLTPSMACILQRELGATKAAAFDINAACSGFVYAMTIAKPLIETGVYKYILIVGCEALSKVTDWEDRGTCVLFGDGAGAAVLGPVEAGYGILNTNIGAEGSLGHNLTLPCCYMNDEDQGKRIHDKKRVLWMDGGEVFKFAVRIMEQSTRKVLEDVDLSLENIAMVFPHQANIRIIDGAVKRLKIPTEKVYKNLHRFGNISSASIPVGLDEAVKGNMLSRGDNIILVGFGGGLTWGSAVIKWSK